MNDKDNPQSMDDVLASIRRIVRSERSADAEDAEQGDDDGSGPLELTPSMLADDTPDAPDAAAVAAFVSAPLHPFDEEQAEHGDDPVVEGTTEAVAAAPASPAIDDVALRELVRDVILEELESGEGAELVRAIIKSELTTGEIGANISRNVLRLIRSEIAKSLD